MKLIDEERLKELLVAEAFAEVLERNGVEEEKRRMVLYDD